METHGLSRLDDSQLLSSLRTDSSMVITKRRSNNVVPSDSEVIAHGLCKYHHV
jgi:hypothetical protein